MHLVNPGRRAQPRQQCIQRTLVHPEPAAYTQLCAGEWRLIQVPMGSSFNQLLTTLLLPYCSPGEKFFSIFLEPAMLPIANSNSTSAEQKHIYCRAAFKLLQYQFRIPGTIELHSAVHGTSHILKFQLAKTLLDVRPS